MDVHITQFNVQLYFRQPVLQNIDRLNTAFSQLDGFAARNMMLKNNKDSSNNNNYYRHHPMQNTVSFFKDGFRIAPVQSNVLPFRILQIMSYPNVLQNPDQDTLACLHYVTVLLEQHLNIDIESDIYAVRVVFHSIVTGSHGIHRILTRLSRIDNIPTLAGKYVGHKNPMDAIQLTYKTGNDLSHKFWNDIRISQFNTNSYVITIFNETDSLASSLDFIRNVKQFVATIMHEMEEAAVAENPI
jgi:hypothetical protein